MQFIPIATAAAREIQSRAVNLMKYQLSQYPRHYVSAYQMISHNLMSWMATSSPNLISSF